VAQIVTPNAAADTASPIDRMQSLLADDLAAIEEILATESASPVDMIPDLSRYIVAAGGKRLRPMVTLAAAHAAGGANAATHNLSAAVEFIHLMKAI